MKNYQKPDVELILLSTEEEIATTLPEISAGTGTAPDGV